MSKNIEKLKHKLFFSVQDIANVLDITRESACVFASRNTHNRRFIRVKNNFYVFSETWNRMSKAKRFELANFLQVPSYISFLTALSFYEVTTQVTRNFFESASLKRSVIFTAGGTQFKYYKLKKRYYSDFDRNNGFFIAEKEKAFADVLYLYSFGKYRLDFNAIDTSKIDLTKLKKIIAIYPKKTQAVAEKKMQINI
jgi:predicted transcriptional regulator of viral defense system